MRSTYLDSLRGVSILFVLLYHYFGMGPLAYGNLGVLLFFVISGYCIGLSMDNSRSPYHFYVKRLGRLLPALLICGLITTAVKIHWPYLLAERPVEWIDPLLTALSLPTLDLLGIRYHFPDWAYWSLVVEFQYYALITLLMFVVRGRQVIHALIAINLLALALLASGHWNHPAQLVYFLPFFIVGASLKAIMVDNETRLGWTGISAAVLIHATNLAMGHATTSVPTSIATLITLVLAVGFFLYGLRHEQRVQANDGRLGLTTRVLAWVGLISYPLYLLHQDVGNTFLSAMGAQCTEPACVLATMHFRLLATPALLITLAWLVYRHVERPTIKPLTRGMYLAPRALATRLFPSARGSDAE